jgi:hypothetical protein
VVNNVSGVYLTHAGFIASYWSAGFGKFLQVLAFASQWLADSANFTPIRKQQIQSQLLLVQEVVGVRY